MGNKTDVWQGTLALMILKTLETMGAQHGYGIARRIEQTSGHLLLVNYGTLNPALLKLGGVEQVKELNRDARSFAWLDDARQDLQYSVRTLRRSPGFASTAVAVIALGIGATTAAFTLLDYVMLRPLPFPQPEKLV